MPAWDKFTPISAERLISAPDGSYAISLTPESKGNIGQYGGDPRDDSSNEIYTFGIAIRPGVAAYIDYVPGRSSDFVNLRVRLNSSSSGTLYVVKNSSSYGYRDPVLLHVDGIISDTELASATAEANEKTELEQKARDTERATTLDAKGKSLATGYIYHGVDEDSQNRRLFDSGALEVGHAYYISNFVVSGNGVTGAVNSLFRDPNYQVVDYVSQKVRGEVVGASQTGFGALPVTVVVAGGKDSLHTPVILGLVERTPY
jgi:hypothetical protein